MNKKNIIKNKLKKDGFVDNFWCIENKITTRLGAYILELKKDGFIFDDNKSGYIKNTKNWAYYLKNKEKTRKVEFLPNGTVKITYV